MPEYEVVIGLEVHIQLRTNSKIFCSCPTSFGQNPNENTCPLCMGMPGALPVLNARAVEFGMKLAMATDCTINKRSVFARKNYFYPDLPHGYQISQLELPIAEHGKMKIAVDGQEKIIGINRIHMEEDAGKNIHSAADNASFVDLNRAGSPLLEIVSEPDMRSSAEAVAYLKNLHAMVLYLGISDGNMEEGSFRCDANVSIRPFGQKEFGIRTELKNINSFRNVQRAIDCEVERQKDALFDGEKIIQQTRLYDAVKNETRPMRDKEEANDYRYFPDPDLVPLVVTDTQLQQWKSELPELPQARKKRIMDEYKLSEQEATILIAQRELADYFEDAVAVFNDPKKISNMMQGELLHALNEKGQTIGDIAFSPRHLASLVKMLTEGTINGNTAKEVFLAVYESGQDPQEYVREKGLVQISDSSELETAVDEVIAQNPQEAQRLQQGDKKLIGFFVGQIMKKTKGQANPKLVNAILEKKLEL